MGDTLNLESRTLDVLHLKRCCRETITRHVVAVATPVEGTRLRCPSCGTRLVYKAESDALPRWRVEQNDKPSG